MLLATGVTLEFTNRNSGHAEDGTFQNVHVQRHPEVLKVGLALMFIFSFNKHLLCTHSMPGTGDTQANTTALPTSGTHSDVGTVNRWEEGDTLVPALQATRAGQALHSMTGDSLFDVRPRRYFPQA